MLFAALGQAKRPLDELGDFFAELWSDPVVLGEVRQLLGVLDDRRRKTTHALAGLPFQVHATYSRDEVSAGLVEVRKGKLLRTQGGVYKCEDHRCDVLFVTLEKDEKDFTPTTLYNDYPLSQRRFHWESQGTTRFESATGQALSAATGGMADSAVRPAGEEGRAEADHALPVPWPGAVCVGVRGAADPDRLGAGAADAGGVVQRGQDRGGLAAAQ